MEDRTNPFESRRVRGLLGLSSGLIVAMVGLFAFEGTTRLLVLGFAALDAVSTPFILKKVAAEGRQGNGPTTR